jgi:hypothetical protein
MTTDGYPVITWMSTPYVAGTSGAAKADTTTVMPATGTPAAELTPEQQMIAGGGELVEAGFGALIPGLVGLLGGWIGSMLGGDTGGAVTTATQAIATTGSTVTETVNGATTVGGVTIGGPGVPEPPSSMVARAWKTKAFSNTVGEYWIYFWKLIDGRVLMYNAARKEAKIWRQPKPVIGPVYRNKLNLKQYVKMERYLDSVTRTIAKRTKSLKKA